MRGDCRKSRRVRPRFITGDESGSDTDELPIAVRYDCATRDERNSSMTLREAFATKPNCLDALRLFFALLVLLAHSWFLAHGNPVAGQPLTSWEPVLCLTRGRLFCGTAAVLFFFMISGFLVTESFMRSRSALEYLK